MKEDYYIIGKVKDDKPFLARVKKVLDNGELEVVLEKNRHFRSVESRISKKDVKLNLGLNPMPGRVHGFDLSNLYRRTIEHPFWGSIHFFVQPEKDVMKMLRKSLDTCAERITRLKLDPYANLIDTEIRAKQGKFAGMYIHSRDENTPHRIWYAPECASDQAFMDYVVYHEFGHVIRHNGLTSNKLRNKWQRLYQKTIAPIKIEANDLAAMIEEMDGYDETEDGFKQVFNTVTEEHGPRVGKAILQWLRQTHRIGNHELEVMWRSSKTEDLRRYWPDHPVDTHDLKPEISLYATKNVEELFSECFAFYCQKKVLPSKVEHLLEHSLSRARDAVKG